MTPMRVGFEVVLHSAHPEADGRHLKYCTSPRRGRRRVCYPAALGGDPRLRLSEATRKAQLSSKAYSFKTEFGALLPEVPH
eukprot:3960771-Pyramimonas_sp.AAC.1